MTAFHEATSRVSRATDSEVGAPRLGQFTSLSLLSRIMRFPRGASAGPLRPVFGGSSRGNPGPGGTGTMIVKADYDDTVASLIWSAAMSLDHHSTTSNQAEYAGFLTDLRVAHHHQWLPLEVVGDNLLVLRQLSKCDPPQNARHHALYGPTGMLADFLDVCKWVHHLRGWNKMTDCAANIAMDTRCRP